MCHTRWPGVNITVFVEILTVVCTFHDKLNEYWLFDVNRFRNDSTSTTVVGKASECAYHHISASIADIVYDVAKIVFSEYPALVQDWVQAIAEVFRKTWSMPALMQSVGVGSDEVLQLQSLRVNCVLMLFDYAARGDVCFASSAKSTKALWVTVAPNLFCVACSPCAYNNIWLNVTFFFADHWIDMFCCSWCNDWLIVKLVFVW